jgi:hypothetical protein
MYWHDYLALAFVAAAAVVVAARAYRVFFGQAKHGCGPACGSCSSNRPEPKQTSLLNIGPRPD